MRYDHKAIEKKWQERWEKEGIFRADDKSKKPKYYALVEFPYPSGEGLHVGHLRPYVGMDIIARKRRMEGFNVLYPIGWDAFGLPAENYAIKTGEHPRVTTEKNSANYRRQIKSVAISFDWSREVNTTDPAYYKWTQWIFLQFFKNGLAYKSKAAINWCPSCKIGLANEEVVGGACERCGGSVEKREKEQWMLKITAYAEKLLAGLKEVDYIERAKVQQENWIGRSEGAIIPFVIARSFTTKQSHPEIIEIFTTRPDTLFGATYLVLAPEHAFVEKVTTDDQRGAVRKYVADARRRSEIERTAVDKEKTGVFTGGYATNPGNGEKIPVWIADYVLMGYGTGAIMAVPAHDERDFEFAKKYRLPIRKVIRPPALAKGIYPEPYALGSSELRVEAECFTGPGVIVNSGSFDGMSSEHAKNEITKFVKGKKTVTYHLRDWVFSRQRYWGEPIPIVFCKKCGTVPVPEKDLPVVLPEVEKFQPTDTGESPLAAVTDWVNTVCPTCGGPAKRETDVMPNWAGSSWYFLRYVDPVNDKALADPKKLAHWMPVDWYNGGMEHTTLHLLYSRFWNQFLFDIGVVPAGEPYQKRTSHGLILAENGEKMSKSRGNVVNPDEIISMHGADTLRVYEMFVGPFDQAVPWSTNGLMGVRRFLERIVGFAEKVSDDKSDNETTRLLHKTIKKVGADIEALKFNTAIAQMMTFVNHLGSLKTVPRDVMKPFIAILAPFAPHVAEEIHEKVCSDKHLVSVESWPEFDPTLAKDETFKLVVQVNGKVRDTVEVSSDSNEDEQKAAALASEKAKKWMADAQISKVIVVAGRLVNIVTRP